VQQERYQQINLGKKFDEIAGPNRVCLHDVLMGGGSLRAL
jgi:hypothetical protein